MAFYRLKTSNQIVHNLPKIGPQDMVHIYIPKRDGATNTNLRTKLGGLERKSGCSTKKITKEKSFACVFCLGVEEVDERWAWALLPGMSLRPTHAMYIFFNNEISVLWYCIKSNTPIVATNKPGKPVVHGRLLRISNYQEMLEILKKEEEHLQKTPARFPKLKAIPAFR